MADIKSIERIHTILKIVKESHFPNMNLIMDKLKESDINPTERTLQRDINTIRNSCFIDIRYNKIKNGYYINEESNKDYSDWMQLFELFNMVKVINKSLILNKDNSEFIDFERQRQKINDSTFSKSISSILEKRSVEILHKSFWRSEEKKIIFYPHLIKQYQNNWYLFGCKENGEIRNYGLDRIISMELGEKFTSKIKNPKSYFDNVIGVSYSSNPTVKVVLEFVNEQENYLLNKPLHFSQIITERKSDTFIVQFNIKLNYELEELILKFGEKVEVLEPKELRDSISERILNLHQKYFK